MRQRMRSCVTSWTHAVVRLPCSHLTYTYSYKRFTSTTRGMIWEAEVRGSLLSGDVGAHDGRHVLANLSWHDPALSLAGMGWAYPAHA